MGNLIVHIAELVKLTNLRKSMRKNQQKRIFSNTILNFELGFSRKR